MMLSPICTVVESTIVLVPETVKLPVTVKLPPIVGLVTNQIVIWLSVTVVSISLAVPTTESASLSKDTVSLPV